MKQDKVRVCTIQQKKKTGERITMLTAYDYPIARLIDKAGIDIVLVSDALGMVGLGYKNTLPVTMDQMIHHTKAVARGIERSFILATMPFMSYEFGLTEAVKNAGRLIKEGGAEGVELEANLNEKDIVRAIVEAGIPVVAHIGLTRKIFSLTGQFKPQGRNASAAKMIIDTALALEDAGAFAAVLECIPDKVSELITQELEIPTIGIGSGPHCNGQSLVTQDLLGLFDQFVPKFAKQYANLSKIIEEALRAYKKDVESGEFPTSTHSFSLNDEELERLQILVRKEVGR